MKQHIVDENDELEKDVVHLALLLPPALSHHVVHKAGQSEIEEIITMPISGEEGEQEVRWSLLEIGIWPFGKEKNSSQAVKFSPKYF